MKKIEVFIKDKNTLVLKENAYEGDYIDLSSLNSVDLINIEEQINNAKDLVYQKKLNEFKDNLLKNKEHELNDLRKQKDYEINQIISKHNLEKEQLNSSKEINFLSSLITDSSIEMIN